MLKDIFIDMEHCLTQNSAPPTSTARQAHTAHALPTFDRIPSSSSSSSSFARSLARLALIRAHEQRAGHRRRVRPAAQLAVDKLRRLPRAVLDRLIAQSHRVRGGVPGLVRAQQPQHRRRHGGRRRPQKVLGVDEDVVDDLGAPDGERANEFEARGLEQQAEDLTVARPRTTRSQHYEGV